jgi:hypothetical protein
MNQPNNDNQKVPMVEHRSAPKPETLVEMTGMRLKVAINVRALIKDTSKDALLNGGKFPETEKTYQPSKHSDEDLLMMAICECVGGDEVRKIPVTTPHKSYNLHHVVFSDPEKRSIGLNDSWRNFYVRSLNEITQSVERTKSNATDLSEENSL